MQYALDQRTKIEMVHEVKMHFCHFLWPLSGQVATLFPKVLTGILGLSNFGT